jgi:hypothetical protein
MIVRLENAIFYWREMDQNWTISENHSSKYDTRAEAESKALMLASSQPDLIGKLHVKNFYENGFESYGQKDLL